jgi:hypothetical protein
VCGKTTLMRATRVAWEAAGHTVAGAATQAVAAQQLQAETGIAARTVASWRWVGLAGVDVLVLDEASLTEDRDRAWLYAAAARTGTKLVEIGDPRQLRGVGCGSVFARVHELVDGPELTENRRQRDEDERAALAAWRTGRYGAALGSWSERGRLVATETPHEAAGAMVGTLAGALGRGPGPARRAARPGDAGGHQQRGSRAAQRRRPGGPGGADRADGRPGAGAPLRRQRQPGGGGAQQHRRDAAVAGAGGGTHLPGGAPGGRRGRGADAAAGVSRP